MEQGFFNPLFDFGRFAAVRESFQKPTGGHDDIRVGRLFGSEDFGLSDFAGLGYANINVNQKTWNEGPYGRERVFVGKNYENRNALTTDATARLLAEIALRREVSAARSSAMLALLEREPFKKGNQDEQATAYTAPALPPGSKLWSKAGWTSTARHDAAYVELPNGKRFVLVTFTSGHSKDKGIIPFVARKIIEGL